MSALEDALIAARKADASGLSDALSAVRSAEDRQDQMPEDAITIYQDDKGGVAYQDSSGALQYTSPAYATSDPDAVMAIVNSEDAVAVSRERFDQQTLDQVGRPAAFAATALSGATRGYSDEAIEKLYGEDARAGVLGAEGAFTRQHPIAAVAGQVGAQIATDVPLAMALTPVKFAAWIKRGGLIGRALKGATVGTGVGAGEMALDASGRAETGERLEAAQEAAPMGAGFGAGVGAASPLIAIGAKWGVAGFKHIVDKIKKTGISKSAADLGISVEALERINQAIEADGGAEALYLRLKEQGDLGSIGSAGGPNVKTALDKVASTPGPGMTVAVEAVTEQSTAAHSLVMNNLDAVLNRPQFRSVIQDAMKAADNGETPALYRAANRVIIDRATPNGRKVYAALAKINPKVLRKALADAAEDMRLEGNPLSHLEVTKSGKIKGTLTVRHLDQIKRILQGTAYDQRKHYDPFTGWRSQTGKRANQARAIIREASIEYSPLYKSALERAASKQGKDAAYDLGGNLLSPKWTKEMAYKRLAELEPAERAHAMQGVRNFIDHKLGEVKSVISGASADGADNQESIKQLNAIFRELSSPNARYKLEQLIGGPDATQLLNTVKKAGIVANLRMQVAIGSKTALRTAAGELDDAILAPGMIGKAARGEHLQSAQAATQALTGKTPEADQLRKAGFYADIAEILAARRGDDALEALSVFTNRSISKMLSKREVNVVVDALSSAGVFASYSAATDISAMSDEDLATAISEAQNGP